jgi:elongator complex protein 2
LEGHTGAVETIACMRAHSIEGETDMIITGSSDGTIRIWERREIDADTGKNSKRYICIITYFYFLDEVICKQIINNGNKYPMSLALSYLPGSKSMYYYSTLDILYLSFYSSSHFRQWTYR